MSETLSIGAIPHRPPFLFVDEIIELAEDRIVTTKLADASLDFFRGHYPHFPVMPGVLVCECCLQAGALLIAHRLGEYDTSKGVPVVTRIQDARFRRMVRPGDLLRVEVRLDDALDGAFHMSGRATVNGQRCTDVKFACMLAREALERP